MRGAGRLRVRLRPGGPARFRAQMPSGRPTILSAFGWRGPVVRLSAALLGATSVTAAITQALSAQETEEIRLRMEYDRLRLYSGIPVNFAERLQLARMQALALPSAGPPGAAGAATRQWRALGPTRTLAGSQATSGRVSTIAIDPRDPAVVYIGAAQGGVWRTDNAGATWRPLTDDACSLAMGSIAVDPVSPDIVYAGTGEQHFSGDSYYGCGVLRSDDAGATWRELGAGVFRSDRGGARISRVHVDPATAGSSTSTVVLAASTFGLFRSTSSGARWTHVLEGTVTDLVMRPGDPSQLYAAVWGQGVYRSGDGGETWTPASPDFGNANIGRLQLAVAPSAPDLLYALAHDLSEDSENGLQLHASEDGGTTWQRRNASGADCHGGCWYYLTMTVNPADSAEVHLGTLFLYRSQDGGASFTRHHPGGVYVDQHFLVFDTLSGPDVLYLANDGGVYRSPDAGASYVGLSTDLAITQFYAGIALHPWDPSATLGGTQDQGTQHSSASSSVWTKVLGGDGGFTAFDAENPEVWYAETQWIAGSGYSGPRRNGGLALFGIDTDERGLFIPPLVMDPVDSRRLYFGLQRLYRTDDEARSWTPIFEGDASGLVITAVAPSASDPRTVYLAAGGWSYGGYSRSGGSVHVTRDGGENWSRSTAGLPDRYVSDIDVHPHDPERAYAVVGGFLSGHVFSTQDGGASWQDQSGNLPDVPAGAVLHDPEDPSGVYVGTDIGVFHSATGGGAWTRLSDGLPTVAVVDLAARPGTGRLVAATHGRGMFELPVDVPLATVRTRPLAVAEEVLAAVDTVVEGDILVAPSGWGDHSAPWSAESDAGWLRLGGADDDAGTASGTGRARVAYRVAPQGRELGLGEHRASVTIAMAGADPVVVPVTVQGGHWSTISTSSTGARRVVLVGREEPVTDSVGVVLVGPRAALTEWTAERSESAWAVLDAAAGTGDGVVTWTGRVADLEPDDYVDTVFVSGPFAGGGPALFVDTLSVRAPLAIPEVRETAGVGVAGLDLAPGGSILPGFTGFGADSAAWTASARSSWLQLTNESGTAPDAIEWVRSALDLEAGVHADTIAVAAPGHPGVAGRIVDRFTVASRIDVETAALQLLGTEGLSPEQAAFLDWLGNGSGEVDAGDVLRWLHHCAPGGERGGCAGADAVAGTASRARTESR